MDTLIAMFFTLGLLGHPAHKPAEQETPKATIRIIPEQAVEPPEERRQRILVTNEWLRELRHVAPTDHAITVAQRTERPAS